MYSVTANRHRFAYREQGSGPVALFVHGFPLDSTMWLDQIADLSDIRRCVAPDLRGFGYSTPTTESDLSMDRHASDLLAILNELGIDRVDLVGFSMGGYIALAFAERHSNRLRSLSMVDSKSAPDSEEGREGRDAAAARVAADGRSALAGDLVGALLDETASLWTQARFRTMVEATPTETIVAALKGMKERPDRTSVLAGLAVPVAVVVGEHDVPTPVSEADRMAKAAGGSLTVIPDAGHLAPIERPAMVSDALRSLWSAEPSG
jgi:pimeloyl-ACP methyl ester carboxylesterase